jgi:hypothetical protein
MVPEKPGQSFGSRPRKLVSQVKQLRSSGHAGVTLDETVSEQERMRIAVPHNRTKQEIVQSVDRTFNEMFQGTTAIPVKLTVLHRRWEGSTLTFSLSAKMGLLSSPISGTIEVTDKDVIIDADLGLLGRFIPADTVRDAIGSRVKGLLKQ